MKKSIFAIAAVCAVACSFAACGENTSNVDAAKVDALNDMLGASYSQVVITVTETFDQSTSLTSEYTVEYSDGEITVNYSVEQFAEISLDSPSAEIKTTLTGTAVISGNDITGGENVNLTADIAVIGLTFKAEYFSDADYGDMLFKADVKAEKASAFLGSEITCTDMTVEAVFLQKFYNINITYTAESGSAVEISYKFTN